MKTYLRLLAFAKPYSDYIPAYVLLLLPAVIFGAVNFSLIIPLLNVLFNTYNEKTVVAYPQFSLSIEYLKNLFDYWFNYIANTYGKSGALKFICAIIMVSVFLSNFFRYYAQRVLNRMRAWVVFKLRKAVFEKISSFHLGFFNNTQKGQLMSVLSNDVNEIENSVVNTLQVIFKEPLVIIVYFIILFKMSFTLTLFTIVFFPVSGYIISTISKKLKRSADISQGVLGKILSVADETISGIRIIKGFTATAFVNSKFESFNSRYRQVSKSIMNRRELASPFSEFLGVLVVVILIVYGGGLVLNNNSELTASEFITYIILYSQILPPAKNISSAITQIQKGLASADRVFNILDTPVKLLDQPGAADLKSFDDKISYENVSFAYGKENVLKNISFEIKKGRTIALVGQSGSGKSTLADLLPRFYDPQQGGIFIDGKNIREYKVNSLRSLMGIVTQEAILFNDSVFNNIAFGMPNMKEDDVMHAAKIANAHDFIFEMERGYQTNIGDRGMKLSGGQRQRISIARAVLKNPPILILDEATSSLDTESERLVQDAIFKLMQHRTTLVIAHRLSTIQHADEIIVLQRGEIVERGKHDELLTANGVYKRLCDLQSFT
ncbi:MAG TPA: ABC transporter ATP-binding protein [Bacteroidia bacterium]|nr:ABC transporter ATP-binding protein [Bacteroidia bacterium]